MKLKEKAERIRIYIGEDRKIGKRPMVEAIVEEARSQGLAGATVFRGITGFGLNSRIRSNKFLSLSEDLPIVVEIVEHPERIEKLLDYLRPHLTEGMVTRESVEVVLYKAGGE